MLRAASTNHLLQNKGDPARNRDEHARIVTHQLEVSKLVHELNDFPDAVLQLAPGCPQDPERFTASEFQKFHAKPEQAP